MKTYKANVFIYKGKNTERRNFTIQSESESKEVLISLIKEKINLEPKRFKFVEEWFEFISKESLVIYEIQLDELDFEEVKKLKVEEVKVEEVKVEEVKVEEVKVEEVKVKKVKSEKTEK